MEKLTGRLERIVARISPKQKSRLRRMVFFPASIFYMELVLRVWSGESFFGIGLVYIVLFSVVAGMVCNLLVSFWPKRVNRIAGWVVISGVTLLFAVQVVFYGVFHSYMELGAAKMAGDVLTNFAAEALRGIADAAVPLLMLLFPLALFQALDLWKRRPVRVNEAGGAATVTVLLQLVAVASILLSTSGLLPLRSVYRESFNVTLGVSDFGLMTSTRLDVQYALFGKPEANLSDAVAVMAEAEPTDEPEETPAVEEEPEPEPEPEPEIEYDYNVLEIDFDALMTGEEDEVLQEMHTYFSGLTGTQQNEYTGYFEGKNLIWLCGEAFHTLAIDEELTPTLYKLSNEGFVFNNFYNPDTGFSTSGGEFETLVSLIPTYRDAFQDTGDLYMPFGFGNLFSDLGYTTLAYHNHTFSYYGRDKSHPNLGYEYKGLGRGLSIGATWPESDLEMMEATVEEYINEDHFHVYYMTVSGHLEYNFYGNAMAAKNQELVEDLPYSDGPRAYLACNIELDLALEYLIDELEKAGKLDDTVIVLSGDHYPYGLSNAEIEELRGEPLEDETFDLHDSTLIIWNSAMEEPVEVDTYCSSLDIMPTLANLFGLPYDSRLVMGTDILSDSEPLVVFASRSWISQYGRFSSRTGEFTLHDGIDPADVPENHAEQMQAQFILMESYSARILEYDYYGVVLGEAEEELEEETGDYAEWEEGADGVE